jgi:hypothetical protein
VSALTSCTPPGANSWRRRFRVLFQWFFTALSVLCRQGNVWDKTNALNSTRCGAGWQHKPGILSKHRQGWHSLDVLRPIRAAAQLQQWCWGPCLPAAWSRVGPAWKVQLPTGFRADISNITTISKKVSRTCQAAAWRCWPICCHRWRALP